MVPPCVPRPTLNEADANEGASSPLQEVSTSYPTACAHVRRPLEHVGRTKCTEHFAFAFFGPIYAYRSRLQLTWNADPKLLPTNVSPPVARYTRFEVRCVVSKDGMLAILLRFTASNDVYM